MKTPCQRQAATGDERRTGARQPAAMDDTRAATLAQRKHQQLAGQSSQAVQLQAHAATQARPPVLQAKWGPALEKMKDPEVLQALSDLGYFPAPALWKIQVKRDDKQVFNSLDELAAALKLKKAGGEPSVLGLRPEVAASSVMDAVAERPEPQSSPALQVDSLASAMEMVSEVSHQKALEAVQSEMPPEKPMAIPERRPALHEEKKEAIEDGPREGAGKPVIVNYIWIGDAQIDAVGKFNVYAWRSLGHVVNIYNQRLDGTKPSAAGLGLEAGDANVIDLADHLKGDLDMQEEEGSLGSKMRGAHEVLTGWIGHAERQTARREKLTVEHRFNMVDMAKSYIGATQRGIVLDLKVGPSAHLEKFGESFATKFISYGRGGKSSAEVENQSMGTMQQLDHLRHIYADRFQMALADNWKMGFPKEQWIARPEERFFGTLTSIHGRAFMPTAKKGQFGPLGMNVSSAVPEGELAGNLKVSEPSSAGQGPFRVMKSAQDQTWQLSGVGSSKSATRPGEVRALAEEVVARELAGPRLKDEGMKLKADAAARAIPHDMYASGW